MPSIAAQPSMESLSVDGIAASLRQVVDSKCEVGAVPVTGSTNEDLVVRARMQQPSACILHATDFQTAGRGRHQRAWRAQPRQGLLFSVAVPLTAVTQATPAVTLACGVALAACLAQCNVAVQLKWPNDLRVGGRKLAGILTELVSDRSGRQTLVIGVGMNLHLDQAARNAIGVPVIALDELINADTLPSCEQWIGRLGGAVIVAAERFALDGFEPFRSEFNRLLEARGEVVDVRSSDSRGPTAIMGRVIEVDGDGRLILDTEGGRISISVGDVSARR